MNEMKVFENEQFGQVRTVMIDDDLWFVASDVCKALEHTNSRMALERLDEDEKGVSSIYTLGGNQDMAIVNESGLYTLVLGSRKRQAKEFKRWITHEVLPAIRKRGYYATDKVNQYMALPQDYPSALRALADKVEQNQLLAAENKVLAKEAMVWDINSFINSLVKAYSKAVANKGPRYAVAWNEFKAVLNNKCRINIEQRVTWYHKRTGKKTRPNTLDMLNEEEKLQAAALIVAMCRDKGIDITDYMKHVPVTLPVVA